GDVTMQGGQIVFNVVAGSQNAFIQTGNPNSSGLNFVMQNNATITLDNGVTDAPIGETYLFGKLNIGNQTLSVGGSQLVRARFTDTISLLGSAATINTTTAAPTGVV